MQTLGNKYTILKTSSSLQVLGFSFLMIFHWLFFKKIFLLKVDSFISPHKILLLYLYPETLERTITSYILYSLVLQHNLSMFPPESSFRKGYGVCMHHLGNYPIHRFHQDTSFLPRVLCNIPGWLCVVLKHLNRLSPSGEEPQARPWGPGSSLTSGTSHEALFDFIFWGSNKDIW